MVAELSLQQYVAADGHVPFAEWFDRLDATAAAKVQTALVRLRSGNTSHVKSVRQGVSGLKIDFGPGYRVYFGRIGELVILLLGGGTKQRQSRDIAAAQTRWREYKARA